MKTKTFPSITVLACLALAASTALAQQIQSFDVVWSGDTPFLESLAAQSVSSGNLGNDRLGCPYVSSAAATGQVQIDMSQVQPGTGTIPPSAIVGFTIVVSNAGSGSGTFSSSNQDFQSSYIDLGGGSLDFSQELVGQMLPGNVPWAGIQDSKTAAPGGDFTFVATDGSLAPSQTAYPYVILTGGSGATDGAYLQVVSLKPSP